jgi:predicted metal-dependent phosphoesterase TrpH
MKCDMHVHSVYSGMCTSPVLGLFCRESYSPPDEVYATLKRRGMDLVTVTDHDSIDAAEALRHHPDFFLSEEVTCRMPSGTVIHVGVYDLREHQHIEIQRRRDAFVSLIAYLREQRLFFSLNHAFSALTGDRKAEDFSLFRACFPAFETRNGHMLPVNNWPAARLARQTRSARVGGSDSHTLTTVGSTYTWVRGARDKGEFLAGVWRGQGRTRGESGGYFKLTRDVFVVSLQMMRERHWAALLAPLMLLIPAATLLHYCEETAFAWRWTKHFSGRWPSSLSPNWLGETSPGELWT